MEANLKKRERYIISYEEKFHGRTYTGLKDKDNGEIIIKASEETGFTSLVPSRRNGKIGYDLPLVATYNKLVNHEYVRGVISIHGINQWEEISLDDVKYNYIDGFEAGLARVNMYKDGKKKWGILGLTKVEDRWKAKLFVDLHYDNMWNFYDKLRTSIPVEKGTLTEDLSLESIRKEHYGDTEFHNDSKSSMKYGNEPKSSIKPSEKELANIHESIQIIDSKINEQPFLGEVEVNNFKRFSESTSIDLSSRITFIVGKNNAGKSSLLDAVEMCTNTMYDMKLSLSGKPYFLFNKENYDIELQKELFLQNRNINSSSSAPIILSLVSGEWKFSFLIQNDALIETITISNQENRSKVSIFKDYVKVNFVTAPSVGYMSAELKRDENDDVQGLALLLSSLWKTISSDYRLSAVQEREAYMMKSSIDNSITTSRGVKRLPVFASIGSKKYRNSSINENGHSACNSDFVSNSIIDYFKIDKKRIYHQFVCKWLQRMEMGSDFILKRDSHDNSYTMGIVNNEGFTTDLCNMGSGTIHFIALCFRLLSLVESFKNNRYTPTLLIEEPEQNLHPMLQSHMTNFLLDISDLYAETFEEGTAGRRMGLKMIVETHSEYIIRRSQVIAKRFAQRNHEIPFRVLYFPSDGKPYDMVYRSNGRFENEFGEGFTDESSILSYQLM